jgi:large subunit ribosomal protein L10
MTKQEKIDIVNEIVATIEQYNGFYITDTAELSVEQINAIRRKCFERDIKITVYKNSLIKKALEQLSYDCSSLYDSLKGASTLMFSETGNVPAKLIKELRKAGNKPVLKAACIDQAIFVGDSQLETLATLKSKNELIGEIVGLLQSPAKNVVSGLQSGSNKLAGIVKTLSERAA